MNDFLTDLVQEIIEDETIANISLPGILRGKEIKIASNIINSINNKHKQRKDKIKKILDEENE